MKPVSPNAQVGGQRPVYAPEESPPCPSLPHPETNIESGKIGPPTRKRAGIGRTCETSDRMFSKRNF